MPPSSLPASLGREEGCGLRDISVPRPYTQNLAHHVSCCSLPARRAGAAGPCRQHETQPKNQGVGQLGSRDGQGILGGAALPPCSMARDKNHGGVPPRLTSLWVPPREEMLGCWGAGLQAGSQAELLLFLSKTQGVIIVWH